ncbi:MAG: serine/threonine-protein kinase, partial [Steroidobacteraceae bacterium]
MIELTPGLELGARFLLVRRLGSGGTSEVWLADDSKRGARVALKVLAPPAVDLIPGLQAELARVQSLGSEHAVPIHELLQTDGLALLVMEFQEGGDLGQFRGRSFESWQQALTDVVAALEAAHASNLVHRDLKCSNVLLDAGGRARLADFGRAALAGSEAAKGGSPYNASPQQLRGEAPAPADDLYALGAMLYELIGGQPPFYPEITRERVLYEPVPPLVARGTVPASVRELALRLLAKMPQERPASLPEIRKQLASMPEERSTTVAAPALASISRQPRRRRRRWLPAALFATALAAGAVFIWLPEYLAGHDAGIEQQARAEAEAARKERAAAEQQSADSATLRTAADEARSRFEAAFAALDKRAAASWATDVFAEARAHGTEAGQKYAVGDYAAARQGWETAAAKLDGLE